MSLTTGLSPLAQDIDDINKRPSNKYNPTFLYEMGLHTTSRDLDYRDGVILNNIKIHRDYVNNISDYTEMQFSCPLGTYIYDIYPYMDNLEVSLYVTKQDYIENRPIQVTERYKAVYLLERNHHVPTITSQKKDDLNQNLPVVIVLQLIDRSAETIRIKTVQGSFDPTLNPRNVDMRPESFLKSLLTDHTARISVENKPAVDSITIEPVDNTTPLRSITIPTGTRVVELVEHLQTKSAGLYHAGVGNYIQKFGKTQKEYTKGYFVYSLYDVSKYDKAEYKFIVYSPPTSVNSLADVTYKYRDKILRVVSETTSKIDDNKESEFMSTGSGYRSADASSIMAKPVMVTLDGPRFSRDRFDTEVVYKERSDGLNFAPSKHIPANNYILSTEVMSKTGRYVSIVLTNMDHDYIHPAQPCKIVYEGKSGVEEVKGVVHKVNVLLEQPAMNMSHLHSSRAVSLNSKMELQVFINR